MIRAFGAFMLMLPLAAVLCVPPAQAQPPQRVAQAGSDYPEESGPPPFQLPNGPDSYYYGGRRGTPPPAGGQDVDRPPAAIGPGANGQSVAVLPPEDQPETGPPQELPDNLKRQLVEYRTREPAGTIIIDTPHTYLYLVLGHGRALRYGIGVGREGFTWSGTERISRMKEWPDWYPPKEMIERQPYLPRMMAGGRGNPLGARALYLGHTLYRIHGTNQPSTIGKTVSSGCIRLLNKDIEDLYNRVQVGTRVVVLPAANEPARAAAQPPPARAAVHRAGDDNDARSSFGRTLFGAPLPPPTR